MRSIDNETSGGDELSVSPTPPPMPSSHQDITTTPGTLNYCSPMIATKPKKINTKRYKVTTIAPLTLIVLIMFGLLTGIAESFVFDRTDPLVYTDTGRYVDKGAVHYSIYMRYANPCMDLRRMHNNVAVVTPAETHCTQIFNSMITNTIADFAQYAATLDFARGPHRHKRSALEVICGMFFGTTLATYVEKVWSATTGDTEMRERESICCGRE